MSIMIWLQTSIKVNYVLNLSPCAASFWIMINSFFFPLQDKIRAHFTYIIFMCGAKSKKKKESEESKGFVFLLSNLQ